MIAIAYLILPVVFFAFWFVDLWVKSYDLPGAQRWATVVLALLAGFAVTLEVRVVALAIESANGPLLRGVSWLLGLPILAALAWLVYDLDWRSVYITTVVAPLLLLVAWPPAHAPQIALVFLMATLISSASVYGEIPSFRVVRYERLLSHGCWCCGYKQRAIRELAELGIPGRAAIDQHIRAHPSQERQIKRELD